MRIANSVHIRVFVRHGEDGGAIKQGLQRLAPYDYAKEKIKLVETRAVGFNEKPIIIVELILEKERHCRQFLESLKERLTPEQKEMLKGQLDSRVDENCDFFIRFDREKLMAGQFLITSGGDCYHVRINVASFPKTRENSMRLLSASVFA